MQHEPSYLETAFAVILIASLIVAGVAIRNELKRGHVAAQQVTWFEGVK